MTRRPPRSPLFPSPPLSRAPAGAPAASPIPKRVGDPSPIKHVFYVVRENRRSEEHTSELQSQSNLVCRLLLEKKKTHQHQPQAAMWLGTPRRSRRVRLDRVL